MLLVSTNRLKPLHYGVTAKNVTLKCYMNFKITTLDMVQLVDTLGLNSWFTSSQYLLRRDKPTPHGRIGYLFLLELGFLHTPTVEQDEMFSKSKQAGFTPLTRAETYCLTCLTSTESTVSHPHVCLSKAQPRQKCKTMSCHQQAVLTFPLFH